MIWLKKFLLFLILYLIITNIYGADINSGLVTKKSSQVTTNLFSAPLLTSTNWDLQLGANYYHNSIGESGRLMFDLRPHVKAGLGLDDINKEFYQSSGNASLGFSLDTKYGDIETFMMSGVGFCFSGNSGQKFKPVGLVGAGISWQSPLHFKIFGMPCYIETGGEVDSYSSLPYPVWKQFFGIRLKF